MTAKRADYTVALDSTTPGVMHRVRTGGEVAVMFEALRVFALMQEPISE
ncbi:MAG: hypothetical protein IPK13_02145 [Deltaproteobacteria bacterium]|nr:hypothetical protein [Deltaproteobacteria bacterium]